MMTASNRCEHAFAKWQALCGSYEDFWYFKGLDLPEACNRGSRARNDDERGEKNRSGQPVS